LCLVSSPALRTSVCPPCFPSPVVLLGGVSEGRREGGRGGRREGGRREGKMEVGREAGRGEDGEREWEGRKEGGGMEGGVKRDSYITKVHNQHKCFVH